MGSSPVASFSIEDRPRHRETHRDLVLRPEVPVGLPGPGGAEHGLCGAILLIEDVRIPPTIHVRCVYRLVECGRLIVARSYEAPRHGLGVLGLRTSMHHPRHDVPPVRVALRYPAGQPDPVAMSIDAHVGDATGPCRRCGTEHDLVAPAPSQVRVSAEGSGSSPRRFHRLVYP